jgi:hypothetical protein
VTGASRSWDEWRYGRLLPAAACSLGRGALYATLVAAIEDRRDHARRDAACGRIQRWLGVSSVRARRLYWRCLRSEAREEADAAFFMRHPAALADAFGSSSPFSAPTGPVIYAGLHLGSPVLGYLHLCRSVASELALVARAIDPDNPMPAAKRRFAERKVAWTEATSGRPFFNTDAGSMLRVRAHLRAGKPLYLLADVPGDAVGRSAACTLFGETVRLAAGLSTLARIAGSAVQTLAVTREPKGFAVRPGPLLAPDAVDLSAVLHALAPFIADFPGQWWMWPYLPPAIDSARP